MCTYGPVFSAHHNSGEISQQTTPSSQDLVGGKAVCLDFTCVSALHSRVRLTGPMQ